MDWILCDVDEFDQMRPFQIKCIWRVRRYENLKLGQIAKESKKV